MYVNIAVLAEIEARERRLTPESSVGAKLIDYCAMRHIPLAVGAPDIPGASSAGALTVSSAAAPRSS